MTPKGVGVLPHMSYMGMHSSKGYGFSVVLVINRQSTLAILVINIGYGVCTLVLSWVCVLEDHHQKP